MTRPALLCVPLSALLFLIAALPWSGAAEDAKPSDPGSADDVVDLVVLLGPRPVLVRLHVTIDGQPYTKHWESQLKRLFNYLDRDGNGTLDKEEAALVPTIDRLQKLFDGNLDFGVQQPNNGQPAVINPLTFAPFDDLDADHDGRVSFDEFVRYFRHSAAGPVELLYQNNEGQGANALTDALFAALDTDKDGKLTKAKLLAAEKVLRVFDTNDDELVSVQELLAESDYQNQANMQGGTLPGGIPAGRIMPNIPLLLMPREDAPRQAVYRMPAVKWLLAEFDKEQKQKVTAAQIGFPKELFEKIDTSKSGSIGARELFRWVTFNPDIEATVRLGRSPGGDRVQVPVAEDDKTKPTFTSKKTAENTLAVAMDNTQMTVVRSETQYPQNQGVKAQYLQQLKALDPDRRGYVRLKELQKLDMDPNAISIKAIFPLADRDDDGKLTEKELSDFLDLMMGMHGSQARLTFADKGQSLFEVLDTNRDGQLSIRELRNAWNRLEEYDRDKKGSIGRKEIPRQHQVLVSQGQAFVNPNAVAGANFGVTIVQSLPTRGPLWFRKMDLNNDGDLSEREFLGSLEDFKKINTSGDGLISVEEAEKADAWFREKMKK